MKKITMALWLGFGLLTLTNCQTIALSAWGGQEDTKSIILARDEYDFKLNLKVPQVVDNSTSLGYRKYTYQTIKGKMYVLWHQDGRYQVEFENLENQQFKVGGKKVTYEGWVDEEIVGTRFTYIGSNKSNSFTIPSLCFYLELEPSYAIGDVSEDNSFYILLSGAGTSTNFKALNCRVARNLYGYASGTQGCGCSAYGHLSPTRIATWFGASDEADDVVATWGTWRAMWKQRNYLQ